MDHSIQDSFLNDLINTRSLAHVFLVNGIKLQGHITRMDTFVLLLKSTSGEQMVYKHAISTIMMASETDLRKDTRIREKTPVVV